MRNIFASVVYGTCLLSNVALVRAQTVQSLVWKIPDGSALDLSSSFQNGATLPVTWNGWDETDFLNGYTTITDLWAYPYKDTATVDGYLVEGQPLCPLIWSESC
jgi:hypothetical protein